MMLRHTTRSLARLSLRSGRSICASAPLRVPEIGEAPSISARPATTPLIIAKENVDVVGESSQTSSQVSSKDVKRQKTKDLHEWDWFRDPLYRESDEPGGIAWTQLATKLRGIRNRTEEYDTAWLSHHHEVARTYRIARARLWTPKDVALSEEEIHSATLLRFDWLQGLLGEAETRLAAALLEQGQENQMSGLSPEISSLKKVIRNTEDRLSAFQWAGRERAIDDLYKENWINLTDKQRKDEMVRVRYECARRLGWRKGYTSGFPRVPGSQEEYVQGRELLEGLGSKKRTEVLAAVKEQAEIEEAAAWQAWTSMDKFTRAEEEKSAWELRDRSLIYTDDSAHILDKPEARWYPQPQKVGSMVFLPNTIVRLVRNTTTRNGSYDAFKATFRVPLSMHKHSLRSYLLAIYGLRTTWCRSLIYRAPIIRDKFRQKRVGPTSRTFKKVEVGILEPFLYPEITPKFQFQHMRKDEMKMLQARTFFKLTGAKRWRGKVPIKPLDSPSRNGKTVMIEDDDSKTIGLKRTRDLPETPKVTRMISTGGIVTKKRKRILQMIHKKTLAREKEIKVKVGELMSEHRQQPKEVKPEQTL
jgi:large subunit ribosomal protein L23